MHWNPYCSDQAFLRMVEGAKMIWLACNTSSSVTSRAQNKSYSNVSCNKVHIYINRANLIALWLGPWIDVGNNCPHIFQCQRTCGRLCRPQNPDLKLVVALFCHSAVRCAPYNTISRSKWTQSSTPRYHLITVHPTIRTIVLFDDMQVFSVAWGGSHLHPRALSLDSPYCKSPDITMNGRQ